jgi:sensor histidine kinase YesM
MYDKKVRGNKLELNSIKKYYLISMTSEEFEIMYRLKAQQPHLVILGAGATMAAIPDG